MLDHYLGLIPGLDQQDVRRRLIPVSVGDWSQRPLTQKILERPRLLRRLRALIGEPSQAVILPFVTTELEARLALELGVPIYGADPRLESTRVEDRAAGTRSPPPACPTRGAPRACARWMT